MMGGGSVAASGFDGVLQDMEGRGLLFVDRAAPAGTSLLLSPAGVEAAGALKRKRKR